MAEYRAHSSNKEGESHGLLEHLQTVAEMACGFSRPFGGEQAAYYAGLWDDFGKLDPEFQRYLSGDRVRGPDHKGAGTKLACQHLGPVGFVIQGHHGGLRAFSGLRGWLTEKGEADAAVKALEQARRTIPDLEPGEVVKIPEFVNEDPIKTELWVRMLFSAVVDADFLDTERHFSPNRSTARDSNVTMQQLWEHFQTRHRETTYNTVGLVNEIRSQIYAACLTSAERPTGVFRLTVPTGGGKTLSAMGFALRHAVVNGLCYRR